MSLDRKIYLATALAAVLLVGAMALAVPSIQDGVVVHVAQTAATR